MKRLLAFLALSSVLLAGCAGFDAAKDAWSGVTEMVTGKDNAEPPRELSEDFEPKIKINFLWRTDIGDGYADHNINLVPAVNEASVFAADANGILESIDRANGERRWKADTELPFSSGPVAFKDKLILGTRDAEVAAFSVADGSLLWKSTLTSAILALPVVSKGVVVVRGTDGRITGLDENTGAALWSQERATPTLAVRSKGGPVIVDDLVIDGYGGGKLVALQLKNGKQEWESTVALAHGRSEIDRLLDINANPVIRGDTIYVSGYQGGVAAVSIKDGEVQWRQEKLFSFSGLTGNRRSLFLADVDSDVWRLDMRNGNDLWKQNELHQRRLTPPVPVKDQLVLGDLEGYVHLLSQDDGSLLARQGIDETPIEAAPAVFEDVIYVYTSGGRLAALTLE